MSATDMPQVDASRAERRKADRSEKEIPLAYMHPADMPPTNDAKEGVQGDLVVESVSKRFRTGSTDVHALDNINLHVRPGEFVCLIGSSGCGKSTLLDIIAGLTRPGDGEVRADGQVVAGPH